MKIAMFFSLLLTLSLEVFATDKKAAQQVPLFPKTASSSVSRQPNASVTPSSVTSVADWAPSTNSLYLHLVPYHKGMGFSGQFEHMLERNLGVGGGLMFLPTKKSEGIPGLTQLFVNARAHIPISHLDIYLAPGIALQAHKGLVGSSETPTNTTLGTHIAVGGVVQFNPQFGIGVEQSWTYAWFNRKAQTNSRLYNGNNSSFFCRMTF